LREDIVFETTLRGRSFTFHSTWGLFSPRGIDEGTRLLIEHLEVGPDADGLDLGCGYGPIGLALAHLAPRGRACLVDKDFVAVEYSRRNAKRNRLGNCEAFLSNGFDRVGERRFDIVASNIPAKVGNEMLTLYLHDSLTHLKPGGQLWIVSLSGLRRFFARALREVFGNYKKIKQGRNHTVSRATKPG
jgi:16S rRNA G1207 methylase RsmC